MPTLALSNSLSFRQMSDPGREFPPIRVLGTIGWIVAGLTIGTLGLEATGVPLRIAGAASVLLGLFCLALPHTPPLPQAAAKRATWSDILGLDALKLLRRAIVRDLRARFVPDLHPAAVLLRVREPVPERAQRAATPPAR